MPELEIYNSFDNHSNGYMLDKVRPRKTNGMCVIKLYNFFLKNASH